MADVPMIRKRICPNCQHPVHPAETFRVSTAELVRHFPLSVRFVCVYCVERLHEEQAYSAAQQRGE